WCRVRLALRWVDGVTEQLTVCRTVNWVRDVLLSPGVNNPRAKAAGAGCGGRRASPTVHRSPSRATAPVGLLSMVFRGPRRLAGECAAVDQSCTNLAHPHASPA